MATLTYTLFYVFFGALLGAAVLLIFWLRDRQGLVRDVARLEVERDAAQIAVADQRSAFAQSQVQVREAFTSLARAALKENRDDFLSSTTSLLSPVKDAMSKIETQLATVDKAREGSYQSVSKELELLRGTQEQLRVQTEGLSRSLSSPNVRGAWGEVQLKRIVEVAGMLPHCDFVEKDTATSENGARQTPDLIVKLPGDARIVVDSKVPLTAYREAANATDASVREQALVSHTRQVRDHIKALGAKEYWKAFEPGVDFVVMFLPLEPLLTTAFDRDDSLFDLAAGLHVIPATPMTLLALLKAVSAGWRQQQLHENAEEIKHIGRELYERLGTMVEHLNDVRLHLERAAVQGPGRQLDEDDRRARGDGIAVEDDCKRRARVD